MDCFRKGDGIGAFLKLAAVTLIVIIMLSVTQSSPSLMRYIRTERADSVVDSTPADNKTIIVITPTKQRPERLADLTMLAQTLKQVGNLYWVVVEDADKTADLVSDLLARTGINHTYLATTNHGLPCRGWAQRNLALDYLRQNKDKFNEKDVIYFADDDNGYDLRLFDQYIRKVDVMGVWAVGIPGNALVEAPKVENGKVVGWHSAYLPDREFATDMAGFALNFGLVVSTK
uniref:Galactosylgalactosylxylosylprotein 3-beta-glucuronosyltransferase n=1 Tax=Bursaphelenchus xylophilus TaxID=6326 RepID=A0A1I7SVH9_BURXY